jgi:hypothetical protein
VSSFVVVGGGIVVGGGGGGVSMELPGMVSK